MCFRKRNWSKKIHKRFILKYEYEKKRICDFKRSLAKIERGNYRESQSDDTVGSV